MTFLLNGKKMKELWIFGLLQHFKCCRLGSGMQSLKAWTSKLSISQCLINADDIRTYRSALMGVAILWVMFYHGGIHWPVFRNGDIGVDIFFFLSAIGLCYSFKKNSDYRSFYKKRLLRIIPTWWIAMAAAMFISSFFFHKIHPSNCGEVMLMFSGIGYWIQGLFNPSLRVVYYEWYIPTLLLFYLLFPLLAKCKSFFLVLLIGLCEAFLYYYKVQSVIHIPWSISSLSLPRVSIFIYGVLYYRFFLSSNRVRGAFFCAIIICAAVTLLSHGYSWYHHYNILLLLPICLKGMCTLFRVAKISFICDFLGGLSLELYMVHINWNIPEFSIGSVTISRYVSYVPQIIFCIGIAMLLRLCVCKFKGAFTKILGAVTPEC